MKKVPEEEGDDVDRYAVAQQAVGLLGGHARREGEVGGKAQQVRDLSWTCRGE